MHWSVARGADVYLAGWHTLLLLGGIKALERKRLVEGPFTEGTPRQSVQHCAQ